MFYKYIKIKCTYKLLKYIVSNPLTCCILNVVRYLHGDLNLYILKRNNSLENSK